MIANAIAVPATIIASPVCPHPQPQPFNNSVTMHSQPAIVAPLLAPAEDYVTQL